MKLNLSLSRALRAATLTKRAIAAAGIDRKDIAVGAGLVALTVGIALIYLPAALIVLGAIILIMGIIGSI